MARLRILTLWHEGEDHGDMPYLLDAMDEYTVENLGGDTSSYDQKKTTRTRELWVEIDETAVRNLFNAPVVQGTTAMVEIKE